MVSFWQNSIDANSGAGKELASYVHPDYKFYQRDWEMIRDAIAGERRVKDQSVKYLPHLDVEFGTSYETYKERAVFVNMTSRTVLGLVGTVFRRNLKVVNDTSKVGVTNNAEGESVSDNLAAQVKADRQLLEDQKNVTIDGLDLNLFAKKLAYEICSMGRIGILVDMPQDDSQKPYMTEYIAENILSWKTQVIKGREVLTYVLLREIVDQTIMLDGSFVPSSSPQSIPVGGLTARYRVLLLENGVYKQRVYELLSSDSTINLSGTNFKEVVPTKGGKPLDFIPFCIMGALSPTADVQKSPVFDIVTLNYAHYRTSAQLEHGRYYTALPVYYVPVAAGQEQGEYQIGPAVVWETPVDSKPGILEYYGTGLKSLADSLHEKEEYIAQLGGRLMGIAPTQSGESENTYKMRQANELSILLNITESLGAGLTRVFSWYQDWQRKPIKGLLVKINQDFKSLQIAARELRAIALLYQEGILPVQAVYESLQTSEFLPEDMSFAEFINLLDNLDNFPNQPDVSAMHDGYPDAQTKLLDKQQNRSLRSEESQADMDRQHQLLIDKRQAEQQSDLQSQMFKQSKLTMQYQSQLDKKAGKNKPQQGANKQPRKQAKPSGGSNSTQ